MKASTVPGAVPPAASEGRYQFGLFEFDADTLELWKSGRLVKTRPQSLRVLALFLARPGELVSRTDLQRGLWGDDTFVDYEQGVNHCIKELRAALGDLADSPRYIETLARRGYRFIAPVQRKSNGSGVLSGEAAPSFALDQPARRTARWPWRQLLIPAGLIALAVVAIAIVARRVPLHETPNVSAISVVPFATHGVEPALGVGLAHAISRRLGGQQLVPVTSLGALADPGSRSDPPTSAAGGLTLRLEGDITTTGDAVVVLARLTRPNDGGVVWSDSFRVRPSELFSVENVLAERVVSALGLHLAAAEQERLRRRYTSNTAAYEDYLRGRAASVLYTPASTLQAIQAFESALQRDANYALARAGLAMACADMYLRFASAADSEAWGERTEREARAALDLDPELAEAHLARAAVARKREFDWNATMEASRRAALLNPNLDQAHFFMAAAYYHLGYMEEATIEMEKGRALQAGDIVEPLRIEALVALFSGNFGPALLHLEEVSRLSSQAIGDTYLALAAYYSGTSERAVTMLGSLTEQRSQATAMRSRAALAGVLAALRQNAAAQSHLDRVLAGSYRDHHVAYSVGVAYAQLGERDRAVQWLRTAADTGFPCLPWFERDPLLDPARRWPEFGDLLTHVRSRRESALSREK